MFSSDKNVKEVQEESLLAMEYFHKLCTENGIHYSVHAGTMLGAVREKGFIPWDDDVDLSMTREEYKKWENLMLSTVLDEYYSFDKDTYSSPRLCLNRPSKPLVWLTIFVYDYISEIRAVQKLKTYGIAYYYNLLLGHDKNIQEEKGNIAKQIAFSVLRKTGGRIKKQKILRDYNCFCEHCFTGKKNYIQRTNDRYCDIGVKKVIPYQYMIKYQTMPFETIEVEITQNYHEILVSSYGADYMIPKKDDTKEALHSEIRATLQG